MVAVNSLSSEMMCNSPLLSLWHFSFSSEQQQQSSPPNLSPLPPRSSLLPCECQPSSPLFSPPTGSRRRPQRPHNKKHPHLHSPPLARSLAPSLPPPLTTPSNQNQNPNTTASATRPSVPAAESREESRIAKPGEAARARPTPRTPQPGGATAASYPSLRALARR
jgi:hypothetical protein